MLVIYQLALVKSDSISNILVGKRGWHTSMGNVYQKRIILVLEYHRIPSRSQDLVRLLRLARKREVERVFEEQI